MRSYLLLLYLLMGGFLLTSCGQPFNPVRHTATAPATAKMPIPSSTGTLEPDTGPLQIQGCSSMKPEPTQQVTGIIPAVSQSDHAVGPEDAAVTLVEYCDFQAPICRSMAAVVSNVAHNHPGEVRFVFRPVPLAGQLDKSELAIQAAIAAGRQEHFWEMYDLLFQNNVEWDPLPKAGFETWLKNKAGGIGLDAEQFAADLNSQETVDEMRTMYESARTFVERVPLLVINGQPQPAFALDYVTIDSTVSLIALGKRQFKECPPFSVDPSRQYIASLHTQHGDVVLQLFPDKAPYAVNSFLFLAGNGWFDDITFHRVIPGFMAQTGDPSGTGRGNAGYFFQNEIDPNLKFDRAGMVGMANQGPDTNGSQFFITYAPASHLDGAYTIFGQVLSGMEVLEKLTPRNPQENPGASPGDRLISVEITEK